jgi:hypothetical protein
VDKEYPKIAVDGDPLMAFWPLATLGYLYTRHPAQWLLVLIVGLTFTSSVSYYELEKLFELVRSQGKRFNQGRWKNESRRKRAGKVIESIVSDGITVGMIIIAINTLCLFAIEARLTLMVLDGQIDTVLIGLFLLPLIWISSLIWRVSGYSS